MRLPGATTKKDAVSTAVLYDANLAIVIFGPNPLLERYV
jgi:hypothetical protein